MKGQIYKLVSLNFSFLLIIILILFLPACDQVELKEKDKNGNEKDSKVGFEVENFDSPPIVRSARDQIGIVTKYDTGYYQGGYPPEGSGACTDVIEQALRANGFDLKTKIDQDMQDNPSRYAHESDPNINFRRVRNVKVYLDHYAESLPISTDDYSIWQPGDIVTYDQIPGSLWHIAIISDKKTKAGRPLLIHNYGRGVIENDYLEDWPASISGHYRIEI